MRSSFALALLLATAAGCADASRPSQPNVVLVCLDTVRADHMGCYGSPVRDTTPGLDALAAEAVQFLDAGRRGFGRS